MGGSTNKSKMLVFIYLQVTPLNRDTLVPDILFRLSGVDCLMLGYGSESHQ